MCDEGFQCNLWKNPTIFDAVRVSHVIKNVVSQKKKCFRELPKGLVCVKYRTILKSTHGYQKGFKCNNNIFLKWGCGAVSWGRITMGMRSARDWGQDIGGFLLMMLTSW